jgi:hypothetical protein
LNECYNILKHRLWWIIPAGAFRPGTWEAAATCCRAATRWRSTSYLPLLCNRYARSPSRCCPRACPPPGGSPRTGWRRPSASWSAASTGRRSRGQSGGGREFTEIHTPTITASHSPATQKVLAGWFISIMVCTQSSLVLARSNESTSCISNYFAAASRATTPNGTANSPNATAAIAACETGSSGGISSGGV